MSKETQDLLTRQFGNGVIALPSGKSMEARVLELLQKAHIRITRPHSRSAIADVSGFPGITKAIFLPPREIPRALFYGVAYYGITGEDNLLESQFQLAEKLVFVRLPFSRATNTKARCVLFTRIGNPVSSVGQCPNLPSMRNVGIIPQSESVVSEYPVETKLFFQKIAREDLKIEAISGGVEAFVAAGRWNYGVALTETGTTLRANGLKEIGTIFESSTVLVARDSFPSSVCKTGAFLGRLLMATVERVGKVYLAMNAPKENVEKIRAFIMEHHATMRGPTVSPILDDDEFCAVGTVVPTDLVNLIKQGLEELGASGFVELEPGSVM